MREYPSTKSTRNLMPYFYPHSLVEHGELAHVEEIACVQFARRVESTPASDSGVLVYPSLMADMDLPPLDHHIGVDGGPVANGTVLYIDSGSGVNLDILS
jgi:hypothetical protein